MNDLLKALSDVNAQEALANEMRVLSYTTVQAAAATGRSLTRIKKAIREGELTAVKDGRATLITRAELERWLGAMRTIGRESDTVEAQHEH